MRYDTRNAGDDAELSGGFFAAQPAVRDNILAHCLFSDAQLDALAPILRCIIHNEYSVGAGFNPHRSAYDVHSEPSEGPWKCLEMWYPGLGDMISRRCRISDEQLMALAPLLEKKLREEWQKGHDSSPCGGW